MERCRSHRRTGQEPPFRRPLSWSPAPPSVPVRSSDLTEEQIDQIARRVVELMSDQVVRNIAWEVIPDLAEMVVKERIRQLEGEAFVKIYTRTGDLGETSLFGGTRVAKNDARIEAYGTVDELSARFSASPARAGCRVRSTRSWSRCSATSSTSARTSRRPAPAAFPASTRSASTELEAAIDAMERELVPLTNFILPGGTLAAAQLHVARTVCRRAERSWSGCTTSRPRRCRRSRT